MDHLEGRPDQDLQQRCFGRKSVNPARENQRRFKPRRHIHPHEQRVGQLHPVECHAILFVEQFVQRIVEGLVLNQKQRFNGQLQRNEFRTWKQPLRRPPMNPAAMTNNTNWLVAATLLLVLGGAPWMALAQNEEDALRYTWTDPLGSARVMAMGGAFGALGADLGCLGINPAGLGLYRRGDLGMTAGFQTSRTESTWLGESQNEGAIGATASNFGVALTYPSVNADWPFFTLAVTHQNRQPFSQQVGIGGVNVPYSLSELFVNQANNHAVANGVGTTESSLTYNDIFPFTAALAWNAYNAELDQGLINPLGDDEFVSAAEGSQNVTRNIDRSGRMAETQIAFGTAYKDAFMFGATLGIPSIEYVDQSNHLEESASPEADLRSWRYIETLDVQGRGLVLRVGALAKVGDRLKVGLAHESKSRLTMTETYDTAIRMNWAGEGEETFYSPYGINEYVIRTPSTTTASASFLLGKAGVVSADYAYSDLSQSSFDDTSTFSVENATIEAGFRATHTGRVGVELRVGDEGAYRIRAGGGMTTSPYVQGATFSSATRTHASLGGGFRLGGVYLNVAWRTAWFERDYYFMGAFEPSNAEALPPGKLLQRNSALVFGAGVRL